MAKDILSDEDKKSPEQISQFIEQELGVLFNEIASELLLSGDKALIYDTEEGQWHAVDLHEQYETSSILLRSFCRVISVVNSSLVLHHLN